MRYIGVFISAALAGSTAMPVWALAQNATAPQQAAEDEQEASQRQPRLQPAAVGDAFVLGQITVHGSQDGGASGQTVSQSVVTSEDIRTQNRNMLDDALRTVPGVQVSNSGGQRNERMIYVRGFDRWQVPLSIDGVRIYLPADNRIDVGRFLTPDLAEIQVQKGYVSVLNGPGGMGGAINLVTRKPTRELEGEMRAGFDIGNTGDLAAYTLFGSVGTRQELFYVQASGSLRDSDGWFLSRNYDPVPPPGGGAPVQGPGRRDFSQVNDWRLNLKAGFTPNATDEYVLSYTHQEGSKGSPYHVRDNVRGVTPVGGWQNNWTWPYWNVSSTSFNSHTEIGQASYVRTKAYYNTFDNLLSAFDDANFNSQSVRGFDSYYHDYAYGFSVEGGTELIPMNTLKAAVHYRRDVHRNTDNEWPGRTAGAGYPVGWTGWEPTVHRSEDTWSLAAENTFHATETIDLVGGVSYDTQKTLRAEFYTPPATPGGGSPGGTISSAPLTSMDAFNWQGAAIWRATPDLEFHASVSARTRFPNLFERYSTRFGTNIPNPGLDAERATNYQIGGTATILDGDARIGGAVFYNDVSNALIRVGGLSCAPIGGAGVDCTQVRNVGKARYYGFEASGEWDVLPSLTIGGNYTLLRSELVDPTSPALKPEGRPEHLAYLYAHWRPVEKLTVSPGIELSSERWSSIGGGAYRAMEGFALVNLNVEYAFNDQTSLTLGVRNILDKHYELRDGFPEPGRTFYVNTRFVF